MRRLLCIFCPPLAVLSTGAIFATFWSLVLTMFFYLPGVIHAWGLVTDWERRRNNRNITSSIESLQYALLLNAQANTIAALNVPPRRRRKTLPPANPLPIDDPYTGTRGRSFRRR